MISRPVAVALLAAGCLSAAVAGSYVAGRQSNASRAETGPVTDSAAGTPAQGVSETEAVVQPQPAPAPVIAPQPAPAEVVAPAAIRPPVEVPAERRTRPTAARRPDPSIARSVPTARETPPVTVERQADPTRPSQPSPHTVVPVPEPEIETARREAPSRPAAPVLEQLVIPASSVIGLEIESAVSSETASVEDRVDARVTRDVLAEGRVAVPAGSRMIGAVTLVERGGKIKERARLGVRFHTLVLADGRQMDLRTETIYREGESVSAESSKKIGGAAIGGAVLGAIMGGGKGALLGGASGAAAGTAVVMAGGRNPATLPTGTVVTARVTNPVTVDVEKR